jgi:copper(I)-binding protein
MRRGTALAILATAVALGGCHPAANKPDGAVSLSVSDAWIRLAPTPSNPSAAYFTLHGGQSEEQLIRVASPQAERGEMHATMGGAHGMSMMAPLGSVPVPARGTVGFAPGGRHVMLYGLDPAATPGREVRLEFTFASGRMLAVQARIRAMGDDGE